MIVMKFGGTSLGDSNRIKKAAEIVKSRLEKNPIVVVSAVSKITDMLIELGNESFKTSGTAILNKIKKIHDKIINDLELDESILENDFEALTALLKKMKNEERVNARILDEFQSFGEQMSSKIVAACLRKTGVEAKAINAWDLGFITDSEYGNAEPLDSAYANIKANIKNNNGVLVITGFLGKDEKNIITTLGRGGSDYTAAIIGNAINAEEIQIWTDVDGIMSTDPRIVKDAVSLDEVSFAEASELAYFGAKVLHPKTILPAMKKNIPVRVLNTIHPENDGTVILSKPNNKSGRIVKSVTCKNKITLININSTRMLGAYGFLARLFYIFDKYKKSVDVISTSEVSVSLTLDNNKNLSNILHELNEIADVEVKENKAIICVVGEGMRHTSGIASRILTAIERKKINIEMISQGASEINTTLVVDGKDAENAVKILHKEYYGK